MAKIYGAAIVAAIIVLVLGRVCIGADTNPTSNQASPKLNSATTREVIDDRRGPELIEAAKKGDLEKLRALLDKGTPINARTKDGVTPLIIATSKGHRGVVALLLEQGADVTPVDPLGRTALIYAALQGREDLVKLFIDHKVDLNAEAKYRQRPISEAAKNGHLGVVRLLLDNGANPNDAIMMAAIFGRAEIVELLLSRGADVNKREELCGSPLVMAASGGHAEVVRLLLDRGADPTIRNGNRATALDAAVREANSDSPDRKSRGRKVVKILSEKGVTVSLRQFAASGNLQQVRRILEGKPDVSAEEKNGALIAASAAQQIEVVKFLLSQGVDPNYAPKQGMSALMWASVKGNVELAKVLKAHGATNGADQGVPAGSFSPPLWMAAFECKVDAVRLLLERGVDVNVRHKGVTPLMIALGSPYSQVESNRCQECARLMLDKGADINAPATSDDGGTEKGLTPLMIATSGGNTDIMKMLLDSGADANASTANGETAFMMAARRGLLEAIKLLSATGADINARNAERENALMRAFDAKRSGVDCVDTVKYLVGSGADVNASDKFGWTPLMKACSNRVPEAAKILVEAGADVNVCSPADNQTPLRLATREGLSEIVQLLKARGAKE